MCSETVFDRFPWDRSYRKHIALDRDACDWCGTRFGFFGMTEGPLRRNINVYPRAACPDPDYSDSLPRWAQICQGCADELWELAEGWDLRDDEFGRDFPESCGFCGRTESEANVVQLSIRQLERNDNEYALCRSCSQIFVRFTRASWRDRLATRRKNWLEHARNRGWVQ